MNTEPLVLATIEQRVERGVALARSLIAACVKRVELWGVDVTPEPTDDQCRALAPLIVAEARLVVEEWRRARTPMESQIVAKAVMGLAATIRQASEVTP